MAGAYQAGFHPHLPSAKYTFMAKALGASMWFFIFYRARFVRHHMSTFAIDQVGLRRKDGAKLLGHHPFEGDGHGHESHH
ncbi:hypothetical protein AX15_006757 [Amanita polypyramis BW_CC]|nr:hypothetical protein AX15_006757 [Amanita polypyramis BW_CC]